MAQNNGSKILTHRQIRIIWLGKLATKWHLALANKVGIANKFSSLNMSTPQASPKEPSSSPASPVKTALTWLNFCIKGYTVHGSKSRSSSFNTQRVVHIYQDPHVDNTKSSCVMATCRIEHESRKYELTVVHGNLGRKSAQTTKSDFQPSNRGHTEIPNSTTKSLNYEVPMRQRWDTNDFDLQGAAFVFTISMEI